MGRTQPMHWDRYKVICDRPDVMSRWMLEQTIEVLAMSGRGDLSALLDPQLLRVLEKPEGHKGGRETDMFELDVQRTRVQEISELVTAAVAANVRTSATMSRGLGGFVEAWHEYRRWIERT